MRKPIFAAALAVAGVMAVPGSAGAQGSPPPASSFEKVILDDYPGEPMNLAVLPDGRVLHTTRQGEIRIYHPESGLNTLAATLDVYQHDEEGLQNVAVDPNFEKNNWVYVYYSPPLKTPADDPKTPALNEGDAPEYGTPAQFARFKGHLQLSRMKLKGDKVDLKSEQKILQVPVDRGMCCHVGGNIDFDDAGNLYLSTGDDSNPFSSDGYAPLDDSANRNPVFDARRSAGNTNDLRGKILRIRPKAHKGGYTIPKGNLFPKGKAKTKPEIYAMGLRNPYRFAVNRANGDVYVGDYSPDADKPDPGARARRSRALDHHQEAGQLWLAVLRHAEPAVRQLRLRHQDVGLAVRLQGRTDQRLAAQHRPQDAAAGRPPDRLVLLPAVPALPAARGGRP